MNNEKQKILEEFRDMCQREFMAKDFDKKVDNFLSQALDRIVAKRDEEVKGMVKNLSGNYDYPDSILNMRDPELEEEAKKGYDIARIDFANEFINSQGNH